MWLYLVSLTTCLLSPPTGEVRSVLAHSGGEGDGLQRHTLPGHAAVGGHQVLLHHPSVGAAEYQCRSKFLLYYQGAFHFIAVKEKGNGLRVSHQDALQGPAVPGFFKLNTIWIPFNRSLPATQDWYHEKILFPFLYFKKYNLYLMHT